MSQSFYGSINLTLLIAEAKKKHSAFTKHDNGNIYCNVTVWYNDNVDKFGNIMSMQINPTKDRKEVDGKPYIGNLKLSTQTHVSDRDVSGLDVDLDVDSKPAPIVGDGPDDLPF